MIDLKLKWNLSRVYIKWSRWSRKSCRQSDLVEILKYEIRKFTKKLSKTISRDARIERQKLEQELKLFESDLQN